MNPKVQHSWEDFLNPDIVRDRLISASIYIAGFESLKDAIIGRCREFYWSGFDESGKEKSNPKYEVNVLSRSKSPVYASLDWLKEMQVVDTEDVEMFDRIKTCRNTLAHDVLESLGPEGMPTDFEKCFQEMVALLNKIEVWWIKEIEIATNPDFDGVAIDETGIVPGRVLGIRLLCDIALGDEKTSRYYYEEFKKRAAGK